MHDEPPWVNNEFNAGEISIDEMANYFTSADGNLQLNIPTTLPNTELEVLIFLRPIIKSSAPNKPKTFSERWQG